MARVTSKLQVTVPKVIADRYQIRPGDDIEWSEAGDSIRVAKVESAPSREARDVVAQRLRRFDAATKRQTRRQRAGLHRPVPGADRGWTREDLYHRGRAR